MSDGGDSGDGRRSRVKGASHQEYKLRERALQSLHRRARQQ